MSRINEPVGMDTFEKELKRLIALDEILQGVNQFTNEELRNEFNAKLSRLYPGKNYEVGQRTFEGLLAYLKSKGAPIKKGRSGRYYSKKWPLADALFEDYNPTRLNVNQLYQAYLITKQFQYFSVVKEIWKDKHKLEEQFQQEGLADKNYIQFDFKTNVGGLDLVEPLLEHVINGDRLSITYNKFTVDNTEEYEFDPYYLKEYKDVWYLIGFKLRGGEVGMRCLALDRITSFRRIGHQDTKPAISIDTHSKDLIGIRNVDKNPETIILKTSSLLANYFRSKPLMPNTEEIETTEEYSIFEFKGILNMELENEILWWGPGVEILKPESLRNSLKERIAEMHATYTDD